MRTAGFLCGVVLVMALGAQAQARPQREEARKQQQRAEARAQREQLRKDQEQVRRQEQAQRDAFLAELVRIERERGLAETAGADRISFAADDAALSKDAELVLIRTIHWLRLHPASVLQLQERCPEPVTKARLSLSKRRTQRVNDFLVDYSASAERVKRLAPAEVGSPDKCAVFLSATPEH